MLSAEPKTTSNTDQLPNISSSLQNRRSFLMLDLTCPFLLHAKSGSSSIEKLSQAHDESDS